MSKTQKEPHKTTKNQKSKKECYSELMLKTINVQRHSVSRQKNQKIQKLKNGPLKPPKIKE